MSDTRRAISRAEFEQELRGPEPGWWQTGAAFIHHSAMKQIEGWDLHGSPGNLRLTEAQRVLMIWADLVGEVANGGVEQFAYNFQKTLPIAERLLPRLEWTELMQRLTPALAEQKDFLQRQQYQEHWFTWSEDLGTVARRRSRMVEQLARVNSGLNPFRRAAEKERLSRLTNDELTELFDAAVKAGKLKREAERSGSSMEAAEVEAPASDAFDDWMYLESTKQASSTIVGAFIRKNRDELVRLTD